MKTLIFTFSLLLLVSCGKDNKSGSRPAPGPGPEFRDNFRTDAQIIKYANTFNGVMVEGTRTNFAIPVRTVLHVFTSSNMIGVIYSDSGLRVRVYNALGKMLMNGSVVMRNALVNVRDDVTGVEYEDRFGKSRFLAIHVGGRTLMDITADDIRPKLDHGVVAVTYRNGTTERVFAIKSTGKVLFADRRNYVRPRFRVDPYTLTLEHVHGVEQIAH